MFTEAPTNPAVGSIEIAGEWAKAAGGALVSNIAAQTAR